MQVLLERKFALEGDVEAAVEYIVQTGSIEESRLRAKEEADAAIAAISVCQHSSRTLFVEIAQKKKKTLCQQDRGNSKCIKNATKYGFFLYNIGREVPLWVLGGRREMKYPSFLFIRCLLIASIPFFVFSNPKSPETPEKPAS